MEQHKLSTHSTLSSTTLRTQLSGSATGNPRNKCALKPGHSLMDWIRLGNSGADLSGTGGRLLSVSKEELVKHNKENDAWMAIGGVVYNVTQYIAFHPGGTEELMRGVGIDATKLFNETHAWVNYTQLLNKCRVGTLVNKVKIDPEIEKSFRLPDINRFTKLLKEPIETEVVPRLDWIQKRENVTLFFYTKQYCNPGLLIRKLTGEDTRLEIWIFIGLYVHRFNLELQENFNWQPENIQISTESGKIQITLRKLNEHLWSDLGNYRMSKILASDLELEVPLEFRIRFKDKFNKDSFVMSLKNELIIYFIPVGQHLAIEDYVNGQKITKCYTPVPKRYINKYVNNEDAKESMHFLIKRYPNPNSFSEYLSNLQKNSKIKISLPRGNLKLSDLAAHKNFCLFAAGSGLTPFLCLIDHLLYRNSNKIKALTLLYFNKTEEDIWCHEILQDISKQDIRFELVNVLSKGSELWTGLRGKPNSDILLPIINKSNENLPFVAACGPSGFTTSVKDILEKTNFPKENLFIF